MNCPKCYHDEYRKDGVVKKRQRYQCKNCNYRYTVILKSNVSPNEIKRIALYMFLEGLRYRTIAKIIGVNYVTVFYWIKEWGMHAKKLKNSAPIRVVEYEELQTIISRNKNKKQGTMLLVDIEKGSSLLCLKGNKKRTIEVK